MAWAGGAFTRANGANEWVTDYNNGVTIEPGRHDAQDNDLATGINQCLNKDGSNSMTGNLNLNNNIPTNIGSGTAAAPAICAGGDVNTGIFSPAADQIGIATNGVERVRLNASGIVDVKTTSGFELAQLSKYSADANQAVQVFRKSRSATLDGNTIVQGGDALGGIAFAGANGTGYDYAASIIAEVDGTPGASSDMPGRLVFRTTSDGSSTTVERMRIDNAGNVGIGCTPLSTYKLEVAGSGTTNAAFATVIRNSANATLLSMRNDGAINTGLAASSPYNNTDPAAANMVVGANGLLYRSTSSLKYKKDVRTYDRGLDAVCTLRPVYYKGKNKEGQYAGLIAEEVHAAGLHEFVAYNDENEPDALHYANMVSLAFKAIQELNAKVEALEAKVAALES